MNNKKQKKIKRYIINDLENLKKEFYHNYNPDFWLYKIDSIKNYHDNFDYFKKLKSLPEFNESDYKRMLRTEMHFLYFQMTEALFEIVLALLHGEDDKLWLYLTFSNWQKNYEIIKLFGEGDQTKLNLNKKTKLTVGNEEREISLCQWIFYYKYKSKMSTTQWKTNIKNIITMLRIFAKDFSDRNEYNAYKHSLRFYNSAFSFTMGINGKNPFHQDNANDSITYLDTYSSNNKKPLTEHQVARVTKPFDFDKDFRYCLMIYYLISNIIETRKHSLLDEYHGKVFNFITFQDIDIKEMARPKTMIIKTQFVC